VARKSTSVYHVFNRRCVCVVKLCFGVCRTEGVCVWLNFVSVCSTEGVCVCAYREHEFAWWARTVCRGVHVVSGPQKKCDIQHVCFTIVFSAVGAPPDPPRYPRDVSVPGRPLEQARRRRGEERIPDQRPPLMAAVHCQRYPVGGSTRQRRQVCWLGFLVWTSVVQ
jgi:hypothetical protein